ncbi:hypothetical protein COCSUDRAFT_55431 [Coccomyxa subellipsoidea C-169]|uniref:Uncharacterized protein n=1 Tax=Coccomyxa subellipsoidea (strain C-169) TaxID=574566 RepID=I0Z9V3_COCSC|nr:hypothetical protein COCSUDRAFT_55431 [Coccomyxa subellipsoidea C-169]EIE27422.1 hypothetical protein COCSUDRAFT_55431 [Coccomyxa subellipsoidea C-169]|eukprot:XP_005651966.1 hypothetical protein COCSUDRAFT_55431 [Coccomyxa subellipsoidea C-169]
MHPVTWYPQAFPVDPGVFQGRPLSPLLFVLAAQPSAGHAGLLAPQQAFQPIRLLGLGSHSHLTGPDPVIGVTFATPGGSVKHLGISLSTQPAAAAAAVAALHTAIVTMVAARIVLSGFRLSLLSWGYVTYHATLVPGPPERLCRAIHTFGAANRQRNSTLPGQADLLSLGKEGRHNACGQPNLDRGTPTQGAGQAAGARVAGLEGLPKKKAQENSLAGSSGPRLALSAPPTYLAAGQIPACLQFSSRAAAGLGDPYQKLLLTDAGRQPLAWEDWARLGIVRISHLNDMLRDPEHQHSTIRDRLPTLLEALHAALVRYWDFTRPWHPRTGKRQKPQEQEEKAPPPPAAALKPYFFGPHHPCPSTHTHAPSHMNSSWGKTVVSTVTVARVSSRNEYEEGVSPARLLDDTTRRSPASTLQAAHSE